MACSTRSGRVPPGGSGVLADHPPHFHVWRIAATGQAAFLSRPSLNRSTAAHPAERWGMSRYRVVQTCGLHNECPRPPRRAHD